MAASTAGAAVEDRDLELPEQDFKYLAGSTDRPWSHFTGRWKAIKPVLSEMLQACGTDRPLRVVDLGSCTGFFSLQAAHRHPEADIVAVEGSVGVGNGSVGPAGSTSQILATPAVRTHLRWIQRLGLTNCFVAPEVWDYAHVSDMALQGRPICDVMLMLSVVHHVDGISAQQYAAAGLSRLEGVLALIGKLLLLSQRHFVELPNRPWLACAYDAYGSQRRILEAAAKASGRKWNFRGPIYTSEWFGQREVWVMEAQAPMPLVDVQACPFPMLYRGEDQDSVGGQEDDLLGDYGALGPYDDISDGLGGAFGDPPLGGDIEGYAEPAASGEPAESSDPAAAAASFGDPSCPLPLACPHLGGSLVDPGLMTLMEPCRPADPHVGEALSAAPTALLLAHLALREAVSEACAVLDDLRGSGLLEDARQQTLAPGNLPHSRVPAGAPVLHAQ